jgi:FAD/FMN-containing dehydrogenase
LAAADLDQLGVTLEGDLFKPGDAGWDAARQAWNLIADQHPDAVVVVSGTDDVAAAVTFARENGWAWSRREPATEPRPSNRSRASC